MKKIAFNTGWTFCEAGNNKRTLSLPHDATQEWGRDANALSGKGGAYFKGGACEYSKTFLAEEEWEENAVYLEFEGIYPQAEIFLNGSKIGECTYGYAGYRFLLDKLRYGTENTVKVVVDGRKTPDSRWYAGVGIYRPVWLWLGANEHICPNGIKVTTRCIHPASIEVETEHTANDCDIQIEVKFNGAFVAKGNGAKAILELPDAKLWDAENPNLYDCTVTLVKNAMVLDRQETRFGIRKLSWSSEGFFVNGNSVLLKGGCVHHDNGVLGARSYPAAEYRRIKRLKEFGFNAIRSSHNPACAAMLDACDALGMYVMDEGWDMWYKPKSKHDYAHRFLAQYEQDIEAIVAKDYNHPSVVMYSIGNEVTEPFEEKGVALGKELVRLFHKNDSTRPVTAGINITLLFMASMGIDLTGSPDGDTGKEQSQIPNTAEMNSTAYNEMVSGYGRQMNMAAALDDADRISSPILDVLDIAGYNYATSRYEIEGEKHPGRIVVGSETYPQDIAENWALVEKYPYLIGDFMWTAWDYLGEVGIGAWTWEKDGIGFDKKYPWLLADAGAFDILGNDNAEAGNAAVVWGKRLTPYIGVVPVNHGGEIPAKAMWRGTNALPYWSYQGCDGSPAEVEVYSIGSEVELFVNHKSLGRKQLQNYKAVFGTLYEPGTIKAVAYDAAGKIVSESSLHSADAQTKIRVLPEETRAGDEIIYLDISLVGQNGEIECNKDTCLTVSVTGGELLAFGSANPRTEQSFIAGQYTTYYGRSQAVVQKQSENIVVTVNGSGFDTVTCKL